MKGQERCRVFVRMFVRSSGQAEGSCLQHGRANKSVAKGGDH